MYRMALDQIPNTGKHIRFKIFRNIGTAFVKLGQFGDAVQSYETIMGGDPDCHTGFNLILCYYALGDADKMRRGFQKLASIPLAAADDDEEHPLDSLKNEGKESEAKDEGKAEAEDAAKTADGLRKELKRSATPASVSFFSGAATPRPVRRAPRRRRGQPVARRAPSSGAAAITTRRRDNHAPRRLQNRSANDPSSAAAPRIRNGSSRRRREAEARNYMLTAARLIAPELKEPDDGMAGYKFVIDALKADHETIASEVEIERALKYMRVKDFGKAIDALKAFERRDPHLKAMAATNLSFIYFLEGDLRAAEKYADMAYEQDRYNARALVNKGNCLAVRAEHETAKQFYLEAIGVEADCVEAIYNLGLVNLKLELWSEALQAFEKLHQIVPNNAEVIYQISALHEARGQLDVALKWYNILVTRVPSDPGVLLRMGQICNRTDDEAQAFHFHLESYRHYPVSLDVISWLGVWRGRRAALEETAVLGFCELRREDHARVPTLPNTLRTVVASPSSVDRSTEYPRRGRGGAATPRKIHVAPRGAAATPRNSHVAPRGAAATPAEYPRRAAFADYQPAGTSSRRCTRRRSTSSSERRRSSRKRSSGV